MKLILDEWIVREVIDTLYMARTTFLGITGLDSPQEVAKKSANETAITRRISKAIDIIQQSKQLPLPEELEEAAEKYRRESCNAAMKPNVDGPTPEYGGSIKAAFIAGAQYAAPRWISVDEKLPEMDVEVIVLTDELGTAPIYKIGFGHIVDVKRCIDYNGWNCPGGKYWMPCPVIPNNEDHE